MTKSLGRGRVGLLLLACVAVLAGPAQAHGAAAPREIDTRVLLDDDGLLGYGGCGLPEELGAPCPVPATGLDVLVLEAREAWLGDEAAIVFRMVTQSEATLPERALRLRFTLDGTQHTFVATSLDGATYTSTDFAHLDGPLDVFDNHPKALDGWIPLAALGAQAGDVLADLHLDSLSGDDPDDLAPGGFVVGGVEAPVVPSEPDPGALAGGEPTSYTLRGPATLLRTESPALLDLATAHNATLRLTNPLAGMPQLVNLTVTLPGGVLGGLDKASLLLDPGNTRLVTFRALPGSAGGDVVVTATSNLGGRTVTVLQVVAAPVVAPGNATGDPSGHDDGHHEGRKDAPAVALLPLALALLAAAGVRRK